MTAPLARLALPLLAVALAACGLSNEEPLAPGTFEVVVTGDAEGEHAGGPVYVAPPDSGRNNVGSPDEYWSVHIPIVFESSLTDGDGAEVTLSVYEPVEPNGSFTELPEGTFDLNLLEYDPTRHAVLGTFRTTETVGADRGTLRLRRTADGVEGDLNARYTESRTNGTVLRGDIRLRFHALAEPPPDPTER
ncbi:MAG: hypothetical protein AAF594_13095 [Bacteroidota bacterium]